MAFARDSLHNPLLCVLTLLGLCLGCQRSARDLPLDKDVGRQSLTAFFDSWMQGQSTASLKDRAPAIIGRDPDWDAGRRLIRYSLGEETDDGTNLHIDTELVFGSERGQDPPQPATYIVGTSPVITIFRND